MNKKWSEVHKQFIRDHADNLSDEAAAAELSRRSGKKITKAAYTKLRQRLMVAKPGGRPRKEGSV